MKEPWEDERIQEEAYRRATPLLRQMIDSFRAMRWSAMPFPMEFDATFEPPNHGEVGVPTQWDCTLRFSCRHSGRQLNFMKIIRDEELKQPTRGRVDYLLNELDREFAHMVMGSIFQALGSPPSGWKQDRTPVFQGWRFLLEPPERLEQVKPVSP